MNTTLYSDLLMFRVDPPAPRGVGLALYDDKSHILETLGALEDPIERFG